MNLSEFKKLNIPDSPGVYMFMSGNTVLYIGKATSLLDRLRSYFNPDVEQTRGAKITRMIKTADGIEFEKTDSVLEAFIRETELIKKYQPPANSLAKDNKSFNYVVITNEEYPRVYTMRSRDIEHSIQEQNTHIASGRGNKKNKDGVTDESDSSHEKLVDYKYIFGPFPYGSELKEALKIIRKIFPFRDTCTPLQGKLCFNRAIGLCPGVCTGEISPSKYRKQIQHIKLFFSGKKAMIVNQLKKQMLQCAKAHAFEDAGQIKKTIFALEHIRDISMLKRNVDMARVQAIEASKKRLSLVSDWQGEKAHRRVRIESYDIAHMSGKDMVGVMCVMYDQEFDKSAYRKFIIKQYSKSNDVGALKEIIARRFEHKEWSMPDIVLVDGGPAQIKAISKQLQIIFKEFEYKGLAFPMPYIASIVKDESHKAKNILYAEDDEGYAQSLHVHASAEDLVKLNAETHRFAITFHKKKRAENFLPNISPKRSPRT